MKQSLTLLLFLCHALAALGQHYPLQVCSFNIQFLGQSKNRDDAALASMLGAYDVVVVQELIAPPYAGRFPDAQTKVR